MFRRALPVLGLLSFCMACSPGLGMNSGATSYITTPDEYARAVHAENPSSICIHIPALPVPPPQPQGKGSLNMLELIPFEFRGCWPGDVMNERALVWQGYVCQTDSVVGRFCINTTDHIGAVRVSTLYALLDGKFAALNLTFAEESYSDILASFVAKFGEPHEQKQEIVQNRMGASFANERSTWHATTGNLEIVRYGPKLTQGTVNFIDYSMVPASEQRQKAKGTAAAKDL